VSTEDTPNHAGLRDLPRDSEVVADYYDNWANDYDRTLRQWQYEAPERVAERLRAERAPQAVILDAGCGTGLSGRALAAAGWLATVPRLFAVHAAGVAPIATHDKDDIVTCLEALRTVGDEIGLL